jgi:hypothetical protein
MMTQQIEQKVIKAVIATALVITAVTVFQSESLFPVQGNKGAQSTHQAQPVKVERTYREVHTMIGTFKENPHFNEGIYIKYVRTPSPDARLLDILYGSGSTYNITRFMVVCRGMNKEKIINDFEIYGGMVRNVSQGISNFDNFLTQDQHDYICQ